MKKIVAVLVAIIIISAFAGCYLTNICDASLCKKTVFQNSDEDLCYHTKEIWCENNGKKIYGVAYIPNGEGKFPLVITSHGLGTNHEAGEDYCREYAKNGFAAYTFDFCGGSDEYTYNLSDGEQLDMSIMTEVSDLEAVLKASKSWDFVDTSKIFLQGGSLGGLITSIAGLRHQSEIAGMILHYPAFCDHDIIRYMYEDYNDIPEVSLIDGYFWAGKRYVQDLWKYDVRPHLSKFKKNVLIIQGDCDDVVPLEVAEQANELFPNSELVVIEGAEHGFGDEEFDIACEAGLEFLYENT